MSATTAPAPDTSVFSGGPASSLGAFAQLTSRADVAGLVAVVTGGSAGLGLYAAQALALSGAQVYILGRRAEVLVAAVASIPVDSLGKLVTVQADVTSKASIASAVQTISAAQGERGIDLLLCNAGIAGRFMDNYGKGGFDTTNFEQMQSELDSFTEEEFSEIFKVNTLGPYLCSTAFLPLLKQGTAWHATQAAGAWPRYTSQVMLVSSNAAVIKLPIINALYNMSKAATSHFGAMLSTMLAESGIRCNTLEPGLYPSDMTAAQGARHAATGHRELEGTNGAAIPAGRAGWPHEHAASVLYLASRASIFANGTRLRVDGGAVQKVPATD